MWYQDKTTAFQRTDQKMQQLMERINELNQAMRACRNEHEKIQDEYLEGYISSTRDFNRALKECDDQYDQLYRDVEKLQKKYSDLYVTISKMRSQQEQKDSVLTETTERG